MLTTPSFSVPGSRSRSLRRNMGLTVEPSGTTLRFGAASLPSDLPPTRQYHPPHWHGQIHTTTGLLVLIGGVAFFPPVASSWAGPHMSRPETVLIADPVVAMAGMLILGVVAVLIAAAIALAEGLI